MRIYILVIRIMNINHSRESKNTISEVQNIPFSSIALWPSGERNSPQVTIDELKQVYLDSVEANIRVMGVRNPDSIRVSLYHAQSIENIFRIGRQYISQPAHKAEWSCGIKLSNSGNFKFDPVISFDPQAFTDKQSLLDVVYHEASHLVFQCDYLLNKIDQDSSGLPAIEIISNAINQYNGDVNARFKTEFFARVVSADYVHKEGENWRRVWEATGTSPIQWQSTEYNDAILYAKEFTHMKIQLYNLLARQYGMDPNKERNSQLVPAADQLFQSYLRDLLHIFMRDDCTMERIKYLINHASSILSRVVQNPYWTYEKFYADFSATIGHWNSWTFSR